MPDLDESLARAQAAIRAQGHAPPGETDAAARKRAAERVKAQQKLIEASRNVVKKLTGMDDRRNGASGDVQITVFDAIGVCLQVAERAIAEARALEQRIAELEARGYQGVYDNEKEYQPGAMVTDHGSIWHTSTKLKGVRPGNNSPFWTLAVKKGRDGKDVR